MTNILKYRDFELEVTLNLEETTIEGRILPNEYKLDIDSDYLISDTIWDVKKAFEEEVDRFWHRENISESAYKYKGILLEIDEVNRLYGFIGNISNAPIGKGVPTFIAKTVDKVKEKFEQYIDQLEHSSEILSLLKREVNDKEIL